MAGPFADYWIAIPAQVPLSTEQKDLAVIDAPNVVTDMVGLLQVQVHTDNTSGLKAVLKINGHKVFTYGPSSTNMSRVLQAVIPGNTLQAGKNTIAGEILAGSGSLTVNSMAIFWQAT